MKQIPKAIAFAAAFLLVAWLGARELISHDMTSTLQIVLPALWVVTLRRKGLCCLSGKANA